MVAQQARPPDSFYCHALAIHADAKVMKNALKPKAAPVRGKPFVDYHRERGLSRVVDAATMVVYDPATLFFDPATEFTFEELRAQRWLTKHSMSMDDFPMVRAGPGLPAGSPAR